MLALFNNCEYICCLFCCCRSIYKKFLEAAEAELRAYVLGDPLDAKTSMGPMALPAAPAFLKLQVDEAVAKGARLLLGGVPCTDGSSRHSRFFPPTLIADANHSMSVMVEESFGPIVAVMPVDNDEQAIALMNDSPYGLTAAVFTKSLPRFHAVATKMSCGTVYLNRSVLQHVFYLNQLNIS